MVETVLTVHKQIFQAANKFVNSLLNTAKSAYFNSKILACSTSKQLYNVTNSLLAKADASPLPSNLPPSDLPSAFSDFLLARSVTSELC